MAALPDFVGQVQPCIAKLIFDGAKLGRFWHIDGAFDKFAQRLLDLERNCSINDAICSSRVDELVLALACDMTGLLGTRLPSARSAYAAPPRFPSKYQRHTPRTLLVCFLLPEYRPSA
jgi:hypothetical protein